jgi:class 3 adenylate cyclase
MITAVYVVFRGYAALAETMQPEKLIKVLNKHLSVAARAVLNHQGMIDKFTGHSLMAIFNAPLPQADHALRAMRAAVELQESLRMFYRGIQPPDRLQCAVGISTGEAVVGDVGIDEIANYTAIGDVVVLAQRIEEDIADGQIVFNDATYRRVSDFVECERLSSRQLRGRSRAVDLFRFVCFKQQTATLHA